MHILITDSGVGGLSVCAYAERFVRTRGCAEPVRLTFANAAPANDYGYNSMPSRDQKLRTFDRFLRNVTARFAPDSIYLACNTLSVLLPDTPYFRSAAIPVKGIVETGVEMLLREMGVRAPAGRPYRAESGVRAAADRPGEVPAGPRSVAMIFGTQTTIDAGTVPRLLEQRGVAPSRIVSQACPGLADTISEDREGAKTASEIRRWVGAAIEKRKGPDAPVLAYLACTHYGYRQELFSAAFEAAGIRAKVVDPNERAVDDLFDRGSGGSAREVEVELVTRYAIPETTLETLTFYLSGISPRTVAAMRGYVHVPDLF